jgi:hypothetical protein
MPSGSYRYVTSGPAFVDVLGESTFNVRLFEKTVGEVTSSGYRRRWP